MKTSTMQKLVLWVEDDPEDQLLIQEAIEDAQVENEFTFVNDGVEALEYLTRTGAFEHLKDEPLPKLVMLDLNMPRKNGLETAKEIKENPDFAQIPIIIFTTSQADTDMMASYDLGVNSFMTKPTSFDGLIEVLRYIESAQFFFM